MKILITTAVMGTAVWFIIKQTSLAKVDVKLIEITMKSMLLSDAKFSPRSTQVPSWWSPIQNQPSLGIALNYIDQLECPLVH